MMRLHSSRHEADAPGLSPLVPERRVLVAGVGNVLRGDDGFGPAVIQALETGGGLPAGVRTVEFGIGGIGLVQELLDGYDALVVVDAVDRKGPPGSLYILEPDVPPIESVPSLERYELLTDLHQAVPGKALIMARALGALPPLVRIIGCQPAEMEGFSTDLSPAVQQSVPAAVEAIRCFLSNLHDQKVSSQEQVRG